MTGETPGPEQTENRDLDIHEVNRLVERMHEAGWIKDHGITWRVGPSATIGVRFIRGTGYLSIDPGKYIKAFNMADERGVLEDGYEVERGDYGQLIIGYWGAVDERYRTFLENAVAMGNVLNGWKAMQGLSERMGAEWFANFLEDLPILSDPSLQRSIRQMEAGELTDITPSEQ